MAGKKGKCPACGEIFTAPEAELTQKKEHQWYYVKQGKRYGPIIKNKMSQLIQSKEISPDDLVWSKTLGDSWVRLNTIRNLFASMPNEDAKSPPDHITKETPNKELMKQARECLRGRWGTAILASLLYLGIISIPNFIPIIGSIAILIIAGPLTLGMVVIILSISRKEDVQLSQLFKGFQNFATAIGSYFLMTIFILLWSLLFIIPGIIAALSYSLTWYIIHDNPSMGPLEALKTSKEMMTGRKWKLFCLGLRFFGWILLCYLTFGIGFLWLAPYMLVSYAKFYEDIISSEK